MALSAEILISEFPAAVTSWGRVPGWNDPLLIAYYRDRTTLRDDRAIQRVTYWASKTYQSTGRAVTAGQLQLALDYEASGRAWLTPGLPTELLYGTGEVGDPTRGTPVTPGSGGVVVPGGNVPATPIRGTAPATPAAGGGFDLGGIASSPWTWAAAGGLAFVMWKRRR